MNNKRWLYLAVATVILLFQGLIYAWSLFSTPFSKIYTDWTVSQLSMTFTISMSCFCLGGVVGGQLSKKLGVKVRLIITTVCLFLGFFSISMLNPADSAGSLTKLYIFYGVFGGGGVGIGYNTVVSTITKWFPDKVGLASGIMLMGFGLGSLLLGSIVNGLVVTLGLFPAFKILAFAITAVMVVGIFVIKLPDGSTDEKADKSVTVNFTTGEMMKTSRFWVFFLWATALNSAGLMVINSAANISMAYGGSAILGMVVSLFNGVGRIVAGNNFDHFARKKSTLINVGFMLTAGIFLMLGGRANSLALITVGLIFVGMTNGGTPTIASAYTNLSFGPENFTSNFSIINFSPLPASFIGPLISAKLLDAAGGRYDTSFIAITVFAMIALALWGLLNNVSKKSVNEGCK